MLRYIFHMPKFRCRKCFCDRPVLTSTAAPGAKHARDASFFFLGHVRVFHGPEVDIRKGACGRDLDHVRQGLPWPRSRSFAGRCSEAFISSPEAEARSHFGYQALQAYLARLARVTKGVSVRETNALRAYLYLMP